MALLGALFGWGLIAADGFAFAAILALAPGVANTEAAASAEIAASAEAVTTTENAGRTRSSLTFRSILSLQRPDFPAFLPGLPILIASIQV